MAQRRPLATAGAAHSITGGTDEHRLRRVHEVEAARRAAARELHSVCADLVAAVNGMLDGSEVLLDPPEYSAASYSDDSPNLVQINVHGRILQVMFAATAELVSTEDFRIPYILEVPSAPLTRRCWTRT